MGGLIDKIRNIFNRGPDQTSTLHSVPAVKPKERVPKPELMTGRHTEQLRAIGGMIGTPPMYDEDLILDLIDWGYLEKSADGLQRTEKAKKYMQSHGGFGPIFDRRQD